LDLLLRTIKDNWANYRDHRFTVDYVTSDDEYLRGYELLFGRYTWVKFVERDQENFKSQFLSLIDDSIPVTCFFADDNLMTGRFSVDDKPFKVFIEDKDVLSLMMAHGKNLDHLADYGPQPLPHFDAENRWTWKGKCPLWGYGMNSTLGTFYRTNEIKSILQSCELRDAPYIEPEIHARPLPNPKMVCYDKSICLENALNMVITEWTNKHGNITAKMLNDKFLQGYSIADTFRGIDNKTPHVILEPEWGLR